MQSVKQISKSPKKRTKIKKVAIRKNKTGEIVSAPTIAAAPTEAEAPISDDEVSKFRHDQRRTSSPTIRQVIFAQ